MGRTGRSLANIRIQGQIADADDGRVAATFATSPVSAASVVHKPGPDEHWSIAVGSTVVAHCKDPVEAQRLAERLNAAKVLGDTFDHTTAAEASPLIPRPRAHRQPRCNGLQLSR